MYICTVQCLYVEFRYMCVRFDNFVRNGTPYYNLGRNKIEQQTPPPPSPPQIKDEVVQKPKRTISPSLIWEGGGGGGGAKVFHLFCPRLQVREF